MTIAARIVLRSATFEDLPILEKWDREPHVIACTTDSPIEDYVPEMDWTEDLGLARDLGPDVWHVLIAERIDEPDPRPIGVIQLIDPALEPTHYWGDVGPNLRALDIWIGEVDHLGQGYGTEMMIQAIERCFANPVVEAILIDPLVSNVDAIRFYRRLGFVPVGKRYFGQDYCFVHRLDRSAVGAHA